jgi:hypothetical protein
VKENEKGCGALLGLEVSAKARTYFGIGIVGNFNMTTDVRKGRNSRSILSND